ncbi:MAG: hypothetical protein JO186_00605 [Actinobacteria bacterium]|nr:hypothetical protein [Actinomycetota bacterium]MBV8396450.1 hypothetical protein [Actinomycetota bacterium]MBV8599164.1 hypothetical protein [Actinomycetota bacterium]
MTFTNLQRRQIVVAGGLALLAALLTAIWVSNASGSGKVSGRLVTVYVATHDIATGTPGSSALANGAVVAKQVPSTAIVPDPVTSPNQISSLVALQPVLSGEQLTTRRFGTPLQQGVRMQLHGDSRILVIPGTQQQLLAGTLQAGDHVDVVASVKDGAQQTPYSRIVLHDLLVVQAPTSTSSGGFAGTASGGYSAAVQLTDAQAQSFFYVLQNGSWSFLLRPAGAGPDENLKATTSGTLIGGADTNAS